MSREEYLVFAIAQNAIAIGHCKDDLAHYEHYAYRAEDHNEGFIVSFNGLLARLNAKRVALCAELNELKSPQPPTPLSEEGKADLKLSIQNLEASLLFWQNKGNTKMGTSIAKLIEERKKTLSSSM